jgi:opacity protein-like surface antigen
VKKLLTIFCLTIASTGFSQNLGIELFAGTSNYQGDLLESRYTFKGAKLALGAGLSYAFTNHITGRAMFMYGQIGADDKNNKDPFLINRNLNFKSSVFEFGVQGLYHILSTDNHRINPYLMAGISLFHFNPYTYDTLGSKYYLKPLSTEGQGLSQYPDRKEYGLTQIAIPFGAGIKFSVTESISIAWEIGLRKTFTDHLDDLSNSYVDQATLLNERGAKAVELAYRGGEIKTGNPVYPADGTVRGGPDFKDWYYFSGIHATFKINDPSFGGRKKGSNTSCPGPVY